MTSLNLQVGASGDDGWDRGTSFTNNDNAQAMGDFFGVTENFQRFTNVTVPVGATITAASLVFNSRDDSGGTGFHVKIRGVAADNPSAPTNHAGFTGLSLTTAGVDWDNPTFTGDVTSPDIASVIQEIVSRPGWASGNALIVVIKDDGSGSGSYRNGNSYDQGSSVAPKLDITYTVPRKGRSLTLTGVG